jgi:CBS-domain-containing membrane protein
MNASTSAARPRKLTLDAETAADLMTPHVVSITTTATVGEAATLLTDKRLSGVPVLDHNGEAVGVLSRADLVAYDCKRYGKLEPVLEDQDKGDWCLRLQPTAPDVSAEEAENCAVRDVMNPVVFSVAKDVSADVVIDALLTLGVHRMFVTDEDATVIGVISTTDVLRHLCRPRGTDSAG